MCVPTCSVSVRERACYKLLMALFYFTSDFKLVDQGNRKDRSWNKDTGIPPFIAVGDGFSFQDEELPQSSVDGLAERVAYLLAPGVCSSLTVWKW